MDADTRKLFVEMSQGVNALENLFSRVRVVLGESEKKLEDTLFRIQAGEEQLRTLQPEVDKVVANANDLIVETRKSTAAKVKATELAATTEIQNINKKLEGTKKDVAQKIKDSEEQGAMAERTIKDLESNIKTLLSRKASVEQGIRDLTQGLNKELSP